MKHNPIPHSRSSPPARDEEQSQGLAFLQEHWKIALIPIGLVIALIIVIVYSSSDDAGTNKYPNTPLGDGFTVNHTLSAGDYWSQFEWDNAAASRKFDEVSVQLTGKVRSVVTEGSKNIVFLETSSGTRNIECQFSSGDGLQSYKWGDQIVLVGEGKARRKPNTDVVLINCRLKP
jgi:hypothetical protein